MKSGAELQLGAGLSSTEGFEDQMRYFEMIARNGRRFLDSWFGVRPHAQAPKFLLVVIFRRQVVKVARHG